MGEAVRYSTHATDIVGYDFNGYSYCAGSCVILAMGENPGAAHPSTESELDAFAEAQGIDRMDERSFDQEEFPKVIFGSHVESSDERCEGCGDSLIP